MMSVAQGMRATVLIIGFPVVMTKNALKWPKDTDFIQSLAAALGMRVKTCEIGIGCAVQPVPFAVNVNTGLVGMEQP